MLTVNSTNNKNTYIEIFAFSCSEILFNVDRVIKSSSDLRFSIARF